MCFYSVVVVVVFFADLLRVSCSNLSPTKSPMETRRDSDSHIGTRGVEIYDHDGLVSNVYFRHLAWLVSRGVAVGSW